MLFITMMDLSSDRALDDFIARQLDGSTWVDGLARELLASGGKRVRSRLTLKAAKILEVPLQLALPWAAANELLHNASLVHDDIQDQDRFRRGRPTMWVQHGLDVALSVGDYLLMKPFLLVSAMEAPASIRVELNHLISEAVARMAVAQVEERALRQHLGESDLKSRYLNVVSGKTSSLFELPVSGIAVLANDAGLPREHIRQAFDLFGQFFQIWDDLKDMLGLKGKPRIGEDLREGKVTAVSCVYSQLRPENVQALQDYFAATERHEADIAHWISELSQPEVISSTRAWLDELWQQFESLLPEVFHQHKFTREIREWVEVT